VAVAVQGEQPEGIAVVVFVPYYRYSVIFHREGLPPLCLLHGKEDELVPFNQGLLLKQELTRRDMPHEFYAYEGLKHYFSTSADSATTQQMFQDSLDCLRRSLEGK
jgi:dipeptidyl aminopeptidase/acylaminoacyl peptidase